MIPSSLDLVARSWTAAAPGYNNLFVSRFAPWTLDALAHLQRRYKGDDVLSLDQTGIAIVPCCGPGQELQPIADIVGSSVQVLGVDIAPGMIDIAQQSAQENNNNIQAVIGDCGDLQSVLLQQNYATTPRVVAIFSVFGLQQLVDPPQALGGWIQVLAPGGLAVVCYWPRNVEESSNGPFTRFSKLVQSRLNKTGAENTKTPSPTGSRVSIDHATTWEDELVPIAEKYGAKVLEDMMIQHEIKWDNIRLFWDAMTRSGPWHKMRLTRGDDFVDGLKDEFCSMYQPNEQVIHQPRARLLVFCRQADE